MINLIISAHGELAPGMVSASNMIFGEQENIATVPFDKEEGLADLQAKYEAVIKEFGETEEFLFLVDVFGGSPYNAASQVIYGKEKMDMITGVNLPLLLEALGGRVGMNLSELVNHLQTTSPETFKVFSQEMAKIKNNKIENLEDDEL